MCSWCQQLVLEAAAKAAESTGSFAIIRISTLILQVFRYSQRHGPGIRYIAGEPVTPSYAVPLCPSAEGAPPAVQATKGAIAAAGSVMEASVHMQSVQSLEPLQKAWTRNPDGLTEEILNTVAQAPSTSSGVLNFIRWCVCVCHACNRRLVERSVDLLDRFSCASRGHRGLQQVRC